MSLRDYFAAKAMQAYLNENTATLSRDLISEFAYIMADAMLRARGE